MDEFRNIAQAAKQIGVSEKTLRRYCIKRLINFYLTAGGHYRFRQSAIDLFLSQHRTIKPTDKRKAPRRKRFNAKDSIFVKLGPKPRALNAVAFDPEDYNI